MASMRNSEPGCNPAQPPTAQTPSPWVTAADPHAAGTLAYNFSVPIVRGGRSWPQIHGILPGILLGTRRGAEARTPPGSGLVTAWEGRSPAGRGPGTTPAWRLAVPETLAECRWVRLEGSFTLGLKAVKRPQAVGSAGTSTVVDVLADRLAWYA
jgi:hypothetical protein